MSDLTLDFSIFAGDAWEYLLPDRVDPQQSPITLSAQLSTAVVFMSFSSGRLSIQPGATTESNVGTYSVQIKLSNDLGAAQSYVIKIVVNAVPAASPDDSSTTSATTADPVSNTTSDDTSQAG